MSDIAIRVENLSKLYHIGRTRQRHDTLRDAVVDLGQRLSGRFRNPQSAIPNQQSADEFWALKDVSFEVKRGEVVGIIGRNGAGKSTLLKILSQITEPTSGRAEIHGRVASLLEVGTGFHPELTGRENIYLNGAILGMRREEITRQFDEIVAFTEIEKFLDTPVKRYSSGMYVRLAFAVAAHLEPEILLVDEVLAVGDAAFQKKALGKMSDVVAKGRTVLFVSHNMTAVKSLCQSAILLRKGNLICVDKAHTVVNSYLSTDQQTILEKTWDTVEIAPGNDELKVKSIEIIPTQTTKTALLTVETPFDVCFQFWCLKSVAFNLSMHVKLASGETVFTSPSSEVECKPGEVKLTCRIPGNLMNDGFYTVTVIVVKESKGAFMVTDGVTFEIHDIERTGHWWGRRPGVVRPTLTWQYDLASD